MKKIDLKQDTDEWFNFRKNKLGASDAPIIMGISPWKTPYQLWQEKLGFRSIPVMNEAMQRGKDLEPLALQSINLELGSEMIPLVFQHESLDFMTASLDGYDEKNKIACEIKCPRGSDHELALQGKIPEKYIPQLQHQMEVCELDSIYYYSYNGIENKLLLLNRDDKFIKKIKDEEKIFWYYLENLECPKLVDRDYSIRNDNEWNSFAMKWRNISDDLFRLQQEEESIREKLIFMANNQNTMGGGLKVSKITRKGNIQYDKIPMLKEIDLEEYRKKPSEFFRISAM